MLPDMVVDLETAHLFGVSELTLPFEVRGKMHWIRGEAHSPVKPDVPIVELCGPESSQNCCNFSAQAEALFRQAVEKLILEGQHFYSMKRVNMPVPNLYWKVVTDP